jgi:uncharacterized protein
MRIYAKVIPRGGKNEVVKISEEEYVIRVTAAPEKGKANKAVIEALAAHFGVPKSSVNIVGGKSSKTKIIDIG